MSWFRIKKKEIDQVKSGFRLVGHILLAMATFGFLFSGFSLVRNPKTISESSWTYQHPLFFGFAFILLTSGVLIWTSDRWRKAIPGLFVLGTLNGFAMIITGQTNSIPHHVIPRWQASVVTVEMLAIALLSLKMVDRELNVWDKCALMSLYYGLAWSVSSPLGSLESVLSPSAGIVGLLIAAGFPRKRKLHRSGISLESKARSADS
jgi:hypothetical protein